MKKFPSFSNELL